MESLKVTCMKMMEESGDRHFRVNQKVNDYDRDDSEVKESDEEKGYGYIQTMSKEQMSVDWINSFEKQKIGVQDVMKSYQNEVLLQRVFGISEK